MRQTDPQNLGIAHCAFELSWIETRHGALQLRTQIDSPLFEFLFVVWETSLTASALSYHSSKSPKTLQEANSSKMESGKGQWYLVSINNRETTPNTSVDRVQHVASGMIMSLENGQRLVFHNQTNGCYFGTDGSIMSMTTDHVLTALHSDLVPVLPNQQPLQGQQGGTNYGNAEEVVLSNLTDAQRPPGTLPGGKWFHQSIACADSKGNESDDKKTTDTTSSSNVRLLYRETDRSGVSRYFTQEGNQVADPNQKDMQMVKMSAHVLNSSSNATVSTQYAQNGNSMLMRGPPGSNPGGKWFKQVYKGNRTQSASTMMCCMHGLAASAIASNIPMDERFVYRNPTVSVHDGKFRYFNMAGGVVHPFQGTFHPLPDETFAPLGYCNADGKIVSAPQHQNPSCNNEPEVEEENKHPPGTQPGGKWHKQTIHKTGRTRLIYRDIVNNGRWFDASGNSVNPKAGPIVPPVTRAETGIY